MVCVTGKIRAVGRATVRRDGETRGYSEVPDVYPKDLMTAGSGHRVQSEATGTSELEGGKAEMPGLPQTAHVTGG